MRNKGPKVAQAAKTMVIGLPERGGRIHLQSMSNCRFESIKPVLDAKLADDTKEVVTDGSHTYKRLMAEHNLAQGNHDRELIESNWTTTQTVENVYDGFGDLIQESSPNTGTTVYYYDSAGNLTKRVAATDSITPYTYDALDRVLTMTFPTDSAEDVTYTYDQSGH